MIPKAVIENISIGVGRNTIASAARRVIKNAGTLLIGNIFNRFCSLIFFVLAARHIGAVGFGKFSFAFSFAASFLVLSDLGFNTVAVRDVAADKALAGKYLGNVILLRMFLLIILLAAASLVITLLDYPLDTSIAVYVLSISAFFTFFSTALSWSFHAFQKMEYDAFMQIVGGLLLVVLSFITLYFRQGLIGLSIAHCATSIVVFGVSLITTVVKFAGPKFEIDWNLWKYLIPASIPIGLVTILCTLRNNIDTVMLSLLEGDAPVGWYNAGVKLVKLLELIPSMFTLALFPVMVEFYKNSGDSLKMIFRKSIVYMFILAVPIAVGGMILSHKIILIVWGAEFLQAVPALQILVWRGAVFFFSTVTCWCLYTINKQKIPMYVYVSGIIINIALNLLLITVLSYIGAAIASAITEFIVAALLFYFAFRVLGANPFQYSMIKITISALLMGAFTRMIRDFNVILVVVVSMIFYCVVLFVLKAIDYKEIRQLISA